MSVEARSVNSSLNSSAKSSASERVHVSRTSPILVVAQKEIRDSLRSTWVHFISGLFLLISLAVTYAGSTVTGVLSLPELPLLMANLTTVTVFIIPLTALLVSYDAIVGEEEAGTLLLMLTYPISRLAFLLGKFIGHSAVMAMTLLLAFGVTLLSLLAMGHYDSLALLIRFGEFFLSSLLLANVFILLGYLISLVSSEKVKALALVLLVWVSLVLFYDLLLLALLVAEVRFISPEAVNLLIALNPADLYRAINILDTQTQGSLSLLAAVTWGSALLYSAFVLWLAGLFSLCVTLFNKRAI